MSELPRGWRTVEVGTVCRAVAKADPIATGREKIRYVDIGSVDGDRQRLGDVPEIPAAGAPTRARQLIKAGDTVFSTVRPYLRKIAWIPPELDGEFASTGFCVLRPGESLDGRFLYYFATCDLLLDQVLPLQRGVSYPAVRDRDVLGARIPLPPLDEQRRIVAILEDHLSRLDAAGAALETASRRARRLGVVLIDDYFRESRDKHVRMSELLAEPMRNGHSASASLTGEGIRTLTLTAVTKNEFSDRNTKLTKADDRRVADLWLTAGDVLVERANTPELVGTSAMFTGPDHWAIFPDLLIRIRIHPDRARPQFVAAAMRSTDVRRFFRSRARGLAGSMPKIDQATVGAAAFPLPSLAAQDGFLNGLIRIDAAGTRLSRATDLAATRSAALRRSLLSAAFSGQLT